VVEAAPVLVEAPPDLQTPPDSVEENEVLEASLVESGVTQIAEIPEPLEVSESEPIEG